MKELEDEDIKMKRQDDTEHAGGRFYHREREGKKPTHEADRSYLLKQGLPLNNYHLEWLERADACYLT